MSPNHAPEPPSETPTNIQIMRVMSHPLRSMILGLLMGEPRSVHQVAELLDVPFTRLYYHFHLLEKNALIKLAETRHVLGGVEEKFYSVTRRSLLFSAANQTEVERIFDEAIRVTHSTGVEALRAGVIKPELPGVAAEGLLIRVGSFLLSAEQVRVFKQRLAALIAEYNAVQPEADPQPYHLLLTMFPIAERVADINDDEDALP